MIAWPGWALLVSALLGLAALAAEKALGLYRRPTRWAWAVAMVGTITVPVTLLVVPRAAPTGAADVAPPVAIEAPVVGQVGHRLLDASASGRPDLAPWLLAAWGLASLVLFGFFGHSAWRLRQERRKWRSVGVVGEEVLESDMLGPAVVGILRTRIAVPGWIRDLDEDLQQLVVAHERAHQTAADPLLLWLGVATCAAVPWCVPLWWQLRRLRLAIEVDCDRRVLAGGASLSRYGSLLLEVGRRSRGRPFALVGLFEPRSFLERRIRVMTLSPPRHRLVLALALAGCTIPVLGLAATLPLPDPLRVNAPPSAREVPIQDSTKIRHVVVWAPDRYGDDVTIDELRGITEMKPTHPATWRRILDRIPVPAGGGCGLDRSSAEAAIRWVEDTGSDRYGFTVPVVCYLIESQIGPDSPMVQPEMPMTLTIQPRFQAVETIEDLYQAGYTSEVHDLRNMVVYRKEILDERDEIGCGMRMEGEVRVFTLEIGERPTGPSFTPWDPDAPPGVCLYLIPKGWDRSTVRFERSAEWKAFGASAAPDPDGPTPPPVTVAVQDTPRFRETSFDVRPQCLEGCSAEAILARFEEPAETLSCDVVVGIRIGPTGTVTGTDMLRSQTGCDEPVREWARSTRWTPAEEDGEPVEVWIAQPVRVIKEPQPAESGA